MREDAGGYGSEFPGGSVTSAMTMTRKDLRSIPFLSNTHAYTHTHTHTHRARERDTQMHRYTQTNVHTHTPTHTHKWTRICTSKWKDATRGFSSCYGSRWVLMDQRQVAIGSYLLSAVGGRHREFLSNSHSTQGQVMAEQQGCSTQTCDYKDK